MTLLRLPRSAAAEILLWLAEHEAQVADNNLGDGAAAYFWDATEQVERGCRIVHRHRARANLCLRGPDAQLQASVDVCGAPGTCASPKTPELKDEPGDNDMPQ